MSEPRKRRAVSVFDANPDASDKSWLATILLASFLGVFGAHRFYVGRKRSAVLQLLFGWASLFIWNLVDWIMIASGRFKDADGKVVSSWVED